MTVPSRAAFSGAIAGVLAGAVGIGIASLVAGLTGPAGSPVVAVGQAAIDLTPPPVKNFAISTFGSNDKVVLQIGIAIVLAVYAAVVGAVVARAIGAARAGASARRSQGLGLAGIGVFCLIGLLAAATRPTFRPQDLLPTLAGSAAAAFALFRLARTAVHGRAPVPAAAASGQAAPAPGAPAVRGRTAGGAGDAATDPGTDRASSEDTAGGAPTAAAADGGSRPVPVPAQTARLQVKEPPRRQFLAYSTAAVGTAGVTWVGGRLLGERASVSAAERALRLPRPARPAPPLPPGADLRIPGLSPFITSNAAFYRVDTALVLPQVPPSSWRLRLHGMVRRELTLSYHDLIRRPLIEDYITLTCVSDPVGGPYISNAKWLGASLGSLLRQAGIRAGADQLFCTSVDGFTSGTPVQTAMDGRNALLAIAMNGQPLPVAHGFPVRTVVPGLYGYVSACKWINDIKVTTYAANAAYWAQRGWSPEATIKTESRIDVPGQGSISKGPTKIAGVAWAQRRGIDAVEVRVDRGPWQHARLAAVPGIDTWRQWVIDWHATPGTHLIEARATDATGYTQAAGQQPPEPNGATGYPSVQVNVGS